MRRDPNPLVDDTNRRIVQGLANGQTYEEIARALPMHRQTLYSRVQRLRATLGAENNEQLVAIALRARYIS